MDFLVTDMSLCSTPSNIFERKTISYWVAKKGEPKSTYGRSISCKAQESSEGCEGGKRTVKTRCPGRTRRKLYSRHDIHASHSWTHRSMDACIRPAQDQASQHSNMVWGGDHEHPPTSGGGIDILKGVSPDWLIKFLWIASYLGAGVYG